MQTPPAHPDEAGRLAALDALSILDTEPEERFDRITRLAQSLFEAPICLISLVDRDRQWFKSRLGTEVPETPRDVSFCGHAILSDEALVVENATEDPRFADNPLVQKEPGVQFYAGMPLKSADGYALGTLCVIDRTPRKFSQDERQLLSDLAHIVENELNSIQLARLQQEVELTQKELRRFFSISLDMLCIASFDGTFKKLNPAWTQVLGYELDELIGRPFLDFVHSEDRASTLAAAAKLTQGEHLIAFENRYRCKDGSYRIIMWSSAPDHELELFMAAARDITEIRRTEAELRDARAQAEEASQAKSRFLANISHEFRTPLNSVIGFSNVLLKDPQGRPAEERITYLDRIRANGEHLLSLVNEILDLSRIEAGRIEVNPSAVSLRPLVSDVARQFEVQVQEKGLELAVDVPDGLADLQTDGKRLRQILINLVGNAIKFTESGSIRVVVTEHDGVAQQIDVVDTGIGIAPEEQERVFDAFQQADAGQARAYEGTGLGLAISQSLCQLLGYRLTLRSEVGQGSTFTIHLTDTDPALPARAAEAEGRTSS